MIYKEHLPFGKTSITAEEYREQIETEKAIPILESKGVEEPRIKLQKFVERVPELILWLESNGKNFSWRSTTDPWKIYIAEILLQRTPGNAVDKIYDDFINTFSCPQKLHEADEETIEEKVETLGFSNHRTKTLKDVGRIFAEDLGDEMPKTRENLKKPWRVGNYVANATLLFAYGRSTELIDVNIARYLEYYLNYPVGDQPHKDENARNLAKSLTPKDPTVARAFYLAMIDRKLDA